MDLEKVEKYFEAFGEFIFRTIRFHLDTIPDNPGNLASVLNFSFQNAFLRMLRDSSSQEQLERFQSESVPRQIAESIDKELQLCEAAEQYFDTLLHRGAAGTVPQAIKEHILGCQECSKKFFKYSLSSFMPLSDQQQFYIKNITRQLVRHFSLLGTNVRCRDAKGFLPTLLDKRLGIQIPTPITAHIDNCPECRTHMNHLAQLNLQPEQLERLSGFYTRPSPQDSLPCPEVSAHIDRIAEFRFDQVPVAVLEHISRCKNCRRLLNDTRKKIPSPTRQPDPDHDWPCEMVSPADLFDMAFFPGLDGSAPHSHIFRGPFIRHVKGCPQCLEKLEQITCLLYAIDEHQDSGIGTCYEVEPEKPNLDLSYGRDIFDQNTYADFNNWPQGAKIVCEQVKRFLPLLADRKTKIKVPAAAIVHIEQCRPCREDLETIRSWKLDHKKHTRLAEFLSRQTFDHSLDCISIQQNQAQIIRSLAGMCLDQLAPRILNHVCLCRNCRDMLYQARQKLSVHTPGHTKSKRAICNHITLADLFDYVFPYGLDPAGDEYVRFKQPLIEHLQNCGICLERIRQLHNGIYAVAERGRFAEPVGYEPDKHSGIGQWHVAQARRLAENVGELNGEQFEALLSHLSRAGDDPYEEWGITVRVISQAPDQPTQTRQTHMTTLQEKDLCEVALEYLYDMTSAKSRKLVPPQIQAHIETCRYCAKELSGIKNYLAEHEGFRSQRKTVAIARRAAYAKEHFEFVEEEVDCRCAKEFLPLLADPKLQITIPTPITVHIDQCSQCATEVVLLRSRNLTSVQLDTLAEFYGESACVPAKKDDRFECHDMHVEDRFIESFARMHFEQLSPRMIKDICLCKECRGQVYEKRRAMIAELDERAEHCGELCASIAASDLLPYCLPRYFDLAEDWFRHLNESVTRHLSHCKICLHKLQRLHAVIYGIADREHSQQTTFYELAPIAWNQDDPNAPIGCKATRPYLPGLVSEPLSLMLPTPLAAHLLDCAQCMDDYSRIDALGLNTDQLHRLGRILAEKPQSPDIRCEHARRAIDKCLTCDFSGIDPDVLEHLRLCPHCRRELHRRRQTMIESLPPDHTGGDDFDCQLVRQTDLFDFCFPTGEVSAPRYLALTSHFPHCRHCLTKMQTLHETVCEIAQKTESGVLTENPAPLPEMEKAGFTPLDHLYDDWPIMVWAKDSAQAQAQQPADLEYDDYPQKDAQTSVISFTERLKARTAAVIKSRPLRKAAAAAMIVMAVGLFVFLNTPVAKAVELRHVYEAVVRIRNVCVTSFVPDRLEPIQKEWISRPLKIALFQRGEQTVLWDIWNKVKKTKSSPSGVATSVPLSDEALSQTKGLISNTFGLLPFEDIKDIPEDAQWNRVDEDSKTSIYGTEIYDLTWSRVVDPRVTEFHKWRLFIDTKTNLPVKEERYEKTSSDADYELEGFRTVSYPLDKDIGEVIHITFDDYPIVY